MNEVPKVPEGTLESTIGAMERLAITLRALRDAIVLTPQLPKLRELLRKVRAERYEAEGHCYDWIRSKVRIRPDTGQPEILDLPAMDFIALEHLDRIYKPRIQRLEALISRAAVHTGRKKVGP